MNRLMKNKMKQLECIKHRQMVYEKNLDKLMEGRIEPEYVHERFNKLKQVKGKN